MRSGSSGHSSCRPCRGRAARGEHVRVAARKRSNTRTAVLPARRSLPSLRGLAPSGRSILAGLALFLLAGGAYLVARETSVFAVQTIEVKGATPAARAAARAALAPELGRSLLRVDGSALEHALAGITGIRSFHYDRAFPNKLVIVLRPERPVLVLRQGVNAYLVSSTGRVLRTLAHPRLSGLPRLYVTKDVHVTVGDRLPPIAAAAAVPLATLTGAPLPGGVRMVENGAKGLNLELGGGLEVRLGDTGDVRLKLAIARRILRTPGVLAAPGGYLDVSVPERPVLSANTQVGG